MNEAPDAINDLKKIMKGVKDDILSKLVGKTEETNVYKAIK
jgi:hypothetical protein